MSKCPYFKSKDCGNPDKTHTYRCNCDDYNNCISYRFLEETKGEKKDGKQDAGENS